MEISILVDVRTTSSRDFHAFRSFGTDRSASMPMSLPLSHNGRRPTWVSVRFWDCKDEETETCRLDYAHSFLFTCQQVSHTRIAHCCKNSATSSFSNTATATMVYVTERSSYVVASRCAREGNMRARARALPRFPRCCCRSFVPWDPSLFGLEGPMDGVLLWCRSFHSYKLVQL